MSERREKRWKALMEEELVLEGAQEGKGRAKERKEGGKREKGFYGRRVRGR